MFQITIMRVVYHLLQEPDSNNGCNGYVQKDMVEDIEKGNALIIGDTTSTCFYQKDDFITGGHIIIFSNF